ncbi:hypothetical protein V8E55_008549 [Tylopilus felleus]
MGFHNGATAGADEQEATTVNSSTSSPGSSTLVLLLAEWTKIKLVSDSWKDVLAAATGFTVPRIMVYRAICERLEMTDCLADATDCFDQMMNELTVTQHDEVEWVLDFKRRCSKKLESLGDAATNAQCHDKAIFRYSAAMPLRRHVSRHGLLVKRSKAYVANGLSKDALSDANEVVKLDPSSPLGYERRHAALRGEGRYKDAIDAFKMMISMISQSSDPDIRDGLRHFVKPEDTEATIRKAVQDVIRDSPRVLIDTTSGRLLNKSEQASMFESSQEFSELVSSMTTYIDTTRIRHEVTRYYRYATLSHAWEADEPLFESMAGVVVYDLKHSPTHDKLQMFCKIVRDAGFHWAWSDSCCIDKQDHTVLQESLVAMFKWYEGSTLVVVYLRDVRSPSKRGDLLRSIWNTQVWTWQAYHAAKVVRFYTEDWTPYLDLDIANHKESPEIISEMEEAMGISARDMKALHPGSRHIREKLSLASRRQATIVEDTAYSLLGIFSVSLPIAYGEGDKALGRLLSHLLASSGDTTILAWTGKSGSFNSCLPADVTAFNQLPTSYILSTSKEATLEAIAANSHASSLSLTLASGLHDQLRTLPLPSVSGKRIKIPCILFHLGHPKRTSKHTFRARADALGVVEITTTDDLCQLDSLYLVHPWIDFLLARQPLGGGGDEVADRSSLRDVPSRPDVSSFALIGQRTPVSGVVARLWQSFSAFQAKPIYNSTSPASLADGRTQVLRFIARLRQPFGALMFSPTGTAAEYRRVATDSMITVQIQEDTPLDSLLPNVRTVDMV